MKQMFAKSLTKEKMCDNMVAWCNLVENAEFDGYIELPVIKTSKLLPENVVVFSRAMSDSEMSEHSFSFLTE